MNETGTFESYLSTMTPVARRLTQRRAWAFCREAVLEHLHPYWYPDQVSWDATYALGESRNEEDKQTWFRRAAANGPL